MLVTLTFASWNQLLRWLRRLDAVRRLGIAGSSAGGLVALMIAMRGEGGNAASEDAVERVKSRAGGCLFSLRRISPILAALRISWRVTPTRGRRS